MRLVLASRSLPEHGGGGMEEIAFVLASELAKNHDVTMLTTPFPQPAGPTGKYPFDLHVLEGAPGSYTHEWMMAVDAYCQHDRPDAVLGVSAAAHRAARNSDRRYPVVMQAHGTSLLEARRRARAGGLRGFVGAARAMRGLVSDLAIYPRYDCVVAISPTVSRSIESLPPGLRPPRIHEIPNGIQPAVDDSRTEENGPIRTILFVGRLDRQKGVHLVIEALTSTDAKLLVVGDGVEATRLEKLASTVGVRDRVEFFGRVNNSEIDGFYRRASVVVAPSLGNEGLPTVALEALRAHRPFVTTTAGAAGFAELPYGVIVADGVPSALAAAIRAADRLDYDRISLPSSNTVSASAAAYATLLEELVNERSAS